MLMAHGFLRRIFEVFDRYETPVDMVATSEVSVSLTIDNTPPPGGDLSPSSRQFAEVDGRADQAIVCLVGDNIRYTPGVGAPRLRRARGRQRPHDLARRVAAESQLRGGGGRPERAPSKRCTRSSSANSTRRFSNDGAPLHETRASSATERWAG